MCNSVAHVQKYVLNLTNPTSINKYIGVVTAYRSAWGRILCFIFKAKSRKVEARGQEKYAINGKAKPILSHYSRQEECYYLLSPRRNLRIKYAGTRARSRKHASTPD